ncbi:MAG: outer membrane beta-barrel protein [Pseudomonadota bacterium]
MMKQTLIALSVFAAGIDAAHASDFSYNYVQGTYSQTETDVDDDSVDIDGLNLTGSFELGDHFFVLVDIGRAEGSERLFGVDVDTEVDSRSLGLGFHTALTDRLDLVASLSRAEADINIDIEGVGELDGDADANLLSVGLRGMATESLELFGNAVYVDGDDDSDTQLNVGALYQFNPSFGVGMSFTTADDSDADTTAVFARVNF